ncbi:hypothetical protein JTB14_031862 [Gonioctena quinquepunctata]|nr:hypothetical protein JTB14_031862 [Gonioctena quinquepunctata]
MLLIFEFSSLVIRRHQKYKYTKNPTATYRESSSTNLDYNDPTDNCTFDNVEWTLGPTENSNQLSKPNMDSNNQNIEYMPDAKNVNEENLNPNAKTSCENLTNHNADKDNPHSKEDHDLNSNLIDAYEDSQLNPGATGATPQYLKPTTSRKRICSNSEIITTEDYLIKRKEEGEAKKKALEIKKNNKKADYKRTEVKQ